LVQGSSIAFSMYDNFNSTVRAAHFDFLPFLGPTPEQVVEENITVMRLESPLQLVFSLFIALRNWKARYTAPSDLQRASVLLLH
jgi:hypothetical protein